MFELSSFVYNKKETYVVEINCFFNIVIPSRDTKVLEFNQYQCSPFIVYADLDGYKKHPEKSSTLEAGEHIPLGFSICTISSFKDIKNKHDIYRIKECMNKFCKFLRRHVMKIINFKEKKVDSKQQEPHKNGKFCYI